MVCDTARLGLNAAVETIHVALFVPVLAIFFMIGARRKVEWAKYNVVLLVLIAAGLLTRGKCHLANLSAKLRGRPRSEKPRFVIPFVRRCGFKDVSDEAILITNRVVFALACVVSLQMARDVDLSRGPRTALGRAYVAFIGVCVALLVVDLAWDPPRRCVNAAAENLSQLVQE